MTWSRRRSIVVATSVLGAADPVVAHEGHAGHGSSGLAGVLAPIAFLLSVLVVSTAVYLDHQEEIDRRWADVGVVGGVLGVLASIVLLA